MGKGKKVLSIEFKSGFLHSGGHPTDEQPEFIQDAKFQGTFHSLHSVVTAVMDSVQFMIKINT